MDARTKEILRIVKMHVWGPIGSVIFHILLLIVLLTVTSGSVVEKAPNVAVTIAEPPPEKEDIQQKVEDVMQKVETPPPEVEDFQTEVNAPVTDMPDMPTPMSSDVPSLGSGVGQGLGGQGTGSGSGDGAGAGYQFSSTRGPLIMKGLFSAAQGGYYGGRTSSGRGAALKAFKAPPGTEEAVMRSLRWLKKNQNPDGSWNKTPAAMTGLALLAFLAHGETPGSPEFGETTQKAIRWLIDHRDAEGGWPRSYQHEIATYALCEAYTMTKIVEVKEAAEKAIGIIIRGQNESGGFDYPLKPGGKRNDTSVMGWAAQAIKAAIMSGMEVDGLEAAAKKAVLGFKANAAPGGGFGYDGPGAGGLTGVGVLCMKLLGAGNQPEVKNGYAVLEGATFNWEGGGTFNQNYYWYYITQAKFQAAGAMWDQWNKICAPTLIKHQTIVAGGIEGVDGKQKDIGFWEMPKDITGHTDGVVMDTCLCTLQLEVYYRYLPTYKEAEVLPVAGGPADDDVAIEVTKKGGG